MIKRLSNACYYLLQFHSVHVSHNKSDKIRSFTFWGFLCQCSIVNTLLYNSGTKISWFSENVFPVCACARARKKSQERINWFQPETAFLFNFDVAFEFIIVLKNFLIFFFLRWKKLLNFDFFSTIYMIWQICVNCMKSIILFTFSFFQHFNIYCSFFDIKENAFFFCDFYIRNH